MCIHIHTPHKTSKPREFGRYGWERMSCHCRVRDQRGQIKIECRAMGMSLSMHEMCSMQQICDIRIANSPYTFCDKMSLFPQKSLVSVPVCDRPEVRSG